MIEVKIRYVNIPFVSKHTKTDFFIYNEIEVKGHAENTGYYNNTRVCAGVSAVTLGIMRLLNEDFKTEHHRGYFHCWTDCKINQAFKNQCDRESVYALNTIVCQLYEIYKNYPNAFKRFDLIEEKENNDEQEITRKSKHTKSARKRNTMGLYSISQSPNLEENR